MTIPTLLIDGYGFVFRAYHVQPSLTSPSGEPVGALYGFASMLIKLLTDFRPVKCAIVFDAGGKNFRHELYPEYKAHRPPAPEDLKQQLPLVRNVATAMGFPILEQIGVEADDVIATVAKRLADAGEEVVIVSSDKDLMQLINSSIKMYDPVKAKYIDEKAVEEKFGVYPNKVRDVLSLIGDSSDNIPGAKGIGPKGAAELIKEFGDLQNLLSSIDSVKQDKKREILKNYRSEIELSWNLVALKYDIDIDHSNLAWITPNREVLTSLIANYGFKSLITRAEKLFGIDLEVKIPARHSEITEIKTSQELQNLLNKAYDEGTFALSANYDNKLYISIAELAYLINLENNSSEDAQADLFSKPSPKLDLKTLWQILSDPSVKKITFNAKIQWHILKKYGAKTFDGFEDIALMRYVLTAGLAQPSFDEFLEQTQISGFQKEYTKYLSELSKQQAFSLYYDIELPVTKVLYKMECTGVKIDQSMLASMSAKFDEEIKILEQQIFKCAGTDFNVASPKQLGEILFEKMKLPSSKTSAKTKVYSTSAEVLEQLSEAGFEIADLLLRWREITKLKNTYTDSLPKKINPVTSRVHTHFVQNLTTTGRLSSQDPNLQNIPIRSKEGAMIREAFVAPEGSMIISADYSQIELRLLADVANVLPLKRAFLNGEDIHAATAAQVFGMDKAEVTPELRRKAKAVNFGIIYGISPFGLAKQLQITRKEAAEIQERYFKEYPGIKKYMDDTKEFVKTHGYVQNMFGRKCHLPLIHDKNFASRSFAERAAINAPLQGGNADIIKLAMIEIHKQFCDNKMNTKIILQVHDELVFEAPNEELEKAKTIIRNAMESVVNLSIPLTVDITSGKNWGK